MEDSVKSFSAENSLQLITFFMAKEIKTFVMRHRFVSTYFSHDNKALGTVTLNAFIFFFHIPTVLVFEYLTHICLQTFPSFVKLFFFYILDFFICYKCIPLDQLFQRLKKEMDLCI